MTQPIWKLLPTSPVRPVNVVWREWLDGRQESCLVTAVEFQDYIKSGGQLLDADGNVMTAAQAFVQELP